MSFGYGGPFRQGYPDNTDYDNDNTENNPPPPQTSRKVEWIVCGIFFAVIALILFIKEHFFPNIR